MSNSHSVVVLRALADDVRLGIVKKIAQNGGMVSSCDIVASCESLTKLSQPTLSHHFSKLVDAGVIRQHKNGTQNTYELNIELLGDIGIDIHKI